MSEPQGKMLKQMVKAVVVAAASAVAVPYTLAVVTNMLYGWPTGPDRYRRALTPKKVYNLNYAILQQLDNLRYAKLYFEWKRFYNYAEEDRLIKDIPYGGNNNALDVYLPLDRQSRPLEGYKPVVVFIYGGSWGSGDKNMYGLLGQQIADVLGAVVVIPNYSIYPKGYVDDMVQDIVDVLTWIHHFGHEFGADKERIMILGHSAGGHLAAMATLELVMKRLLTNPESLIQPPSVEMSRQSSVFTESMKFEEGHFDRSSGSNGDNGEGGQGDRHPSLPAPESASTTGSFYFVDTKNKQESTSESFLVLDEKEDKSEDQEEVQEGETESEEKDKDSDSGSGEKIDIADVDKTDGEEVDKPKEGSEEVVDKESSDEEPKLDLSGLQSSEIQEEKPEPDLTQSQREVRDLLSSIRVVVGLAGVYHIADHYKHEEWRGVEDISTMAKAMYGCDFFDRFSPSHIIPNLPHNTRFPPVHLIHGDQDTTVPYTSSTKFGEALWELGSRDVQVTMLPGCGHKDICLDLMSPKRGWYEPVIGAIMDTANRYL